MPPATSNNRTQRKRPGDLTGVRGQALASEAAAQKAEAQKAVAASLEEQRVERATHDVDYSTASDVVLEDIVVGDDTVIIEDIAVEKKTRRIRVNYPIDDMTFGREIVSDAEYDDNGLMTKAPVVGSLRTFSFEEGRYYIVDKDVADHLRNLGYIYE